jgi:hypothetical protein
VILCRSLVALTPASRTRRCLLTCVSVSIDEFRVCYLCLTVSWFVAGRAGAAGSTGSVRLHAGGSHHVVDSKPFQSNGRRETTAFTVVTIKYPSPTHHLRIMYSTILFPKVSGSEAMQCIVQKSINDNCNCTAYIIFINIQRCTRRLSSGGFPAVITRISKSVVRRFCHVRISGSQSRATLPLAHF